MYWAHANVILPSNEFNILQIVPVIQNETLQFLDEIYFAHVFIHNFAYAALILQICNWVPFRKFSQ